MRVLLAAGIVCAGWACSSDPPVIPPDGAGTVVWSYPIPESFLDAVKPVIVNNDVFVASDSTIARVDLQNGTIRWRINYGTTGGSFASRMLVDGGNVLYLNHMSLVKAIVKETGLFAWETVVPGFTGVDLSSMAIDDGHLYLGGRGQVVRILRSTGTADLNIPLDSLSTGSEPQACFYPVVSPSDNRLYVPTSYWNAAVGATEGSLLCFDAITGGFLWGYRMASPKVWIGALGDSAHTDAGSYGCAIADSLVVVASGQNLFALNRITGSHVWTAFIPDGGYYMPPTIGQGRVFIGSNNSYVYAFSLDNGQLLWKTKTSGGIATLFSVVDQRVYLCNVGGGDIWVLGSINGDVIWRGHPPEFAKDPYAVYGSPVAVGQDHIVNVGSKRVYCLKVP